MVKIKFQKIKKGKKMWPRCKILLVMTLGTLLHSGSTMPDGGLQEKRTEQLHDRYSLEWQANFDEKTIDFWIECETTGFIGFGFSQSGSMAGADLVIGGVGGDNKIYFQDYHGTANDFPVLDDEQNWEAINITEENGVTSMHLRRPLDTCDSNDLRIDDGTIKIMWSIGATDKLEYHGNEFRGSLAMNMLDPPVPPVDLSSFDTHNMTVTVPMDGSVNTIYWCSIFKRTSPAKSHIVAFQPKFDTPEALKYTHHFNVYTCKAEEGMDPDVVFGQYVDLPGQNCLLDKGGLATVRYMCYQNLYAWSKGGRILVFPEDIGVAWGEERTEYFLMEVHLDNKEMDAVEVDTGVVIYHTENLRKIEGGLLTIGFATWPSLLIPPATNDYTLAGHCSSACTNRGIENKDGINMFNLNLHAHVSGRKMKMRQFRDGTELSWPAKDDTYDFDYQENRPLTSPLKVMPGDHMTFECTYDSNWKSPPGPIIGGATSYDEMCLVFIFYYPRIQLESCYSGYSRTKIMNRFGITNYTYILGSDDPEIVEPAKWAGKRFTEVVNMTVWDGPAKEELNKELRFGMHDEFCFTRDDASKKGKSNKISLLSSIGTDSWKNVGDRAEDTVEITYPNFGADYTEPDTCSDSDNAPALVSMVSLIVFSILVVSIVT